MGKKLIRCNKCLMPRDTKGLSFDVNGVCSLCTEYFQIPQSEDTQDAITLQNKNLEIIRKRGANTTYDCVVGVSGGSDSTYLLYLLARRHGLRCLAAYYRTPFTPKEIDDNIRKITASLSVPLVDINLSHEYHRRTAAYFVRLWNETRDQTIANLACAPCKILNRELFRIARKHGIRSIVHGINKYESVSVAAGQLRSNSRDPYSFGTNLLRIFVIAVRGASVLFRYPGVMRYFKLAFNSSVLYLSPYTVFLRLRYPSIHILNYFHEIEWNEQDVKQTLEDIGWRRPIGFPSMKKADCAFAHLKNKMTSLTSGSNYSDSIFSNMVRYGLIERNEALSRLQREGLPPEGPISEACRIIGLQEGFIKN